ncbi:MAG: ABC transporter ATP-binding protein, partial [Candidatus Goldiibacteriota bacterium]
MLKLTGLKKDYGKFTAVNSINLEVKKGEVFGFLGPNGAGKTSTIKMMCGLTTITEGDAVIDGISIKKDPVAYKKQFALIPDKPYMFDKLRGIEYVEFMASLYGVEKQRFKNNLDKYASIFGVDEYINGFIESYSHGMSQKLLITAALVHEPKVFILDEPMVGLDPKSMKILRDEFKELAAAGMTIFMSTHSLDTAEEVCSNVGIIDHGNILESGNLREILKKGR